MIDIEKTGIKIKYVPYTPLKKSSFSSEDEIHLWITPLEELNKPDYFEECYTVLSDEERLKAKNFRFKRDKKRYVLSRGILRKILCSYSGNSPESFIFDYHKNGKPFIASSRVHDIDLQFNTSHSNNIVAHVFSLKNRVGIDVEFIRPLPELNSMISGNLSAKERTHLLSVKDEAEKLRLFFVYWTHKESYLKATGEGITVGLKYTGFDYNGKNELHLDPAADDSGCWRFFSFYHMYGYMGACAVDSLKSNLKCFMITP